MQVADIKFVTQKSWPSMGFISRFLKNVSNSGYC